MQRLAIFALFIFALVLAGCAGNEVASTGHSTPTPTPVSQATPTPTATPSATPLSACNQVSTGAEASLNGFVSFSGASAWNQDISSALPDSNSTIIGALQSTPLHADFGSGQYQGQFIGIPYVVVNSPAHVAVHFTASGSESDPGPMPIPAGAPIEGDPNPGSGDRHVLVFDISNCWLYELFNSFPQSDGSWNADSAAIWDLLDNQQRPYTWTSADAAGLPIFPGLVRYDEVASGKIQHALRFTMHNSLAAFVPPASHWAATSTASSAAPMGMRLRLKANVDISSFSKNNQVILTALKKYGMIMADNGGDLFLSGTPDSRWDNNDLHALGSITGSNFEVVAMNPVYTQNNIPSGPAPSIGSFGASAASVNAGTSVTLNWSVSNASYLIISPLPGPVRGTSVTITPSATTTYTLYTANQYGRSTATVTVTVH